MSSVISRPALLGAGAGAALALAALNSAPALAASASGVRAMPQTRVGNNVVYPIRTLNPGDSVDSGRVRLVMQEDGNLVLYSDATNASLWATGTTGVNVAVLQSDGNFVVYPRNAAGNPFFARWQSGTSGDNVLDVQADGNVVIYPANAIGVAGQAEWSTNTRV